VDDGHTQLGHEPQHNPNPGTGSGQGRKKKISHRH